jgi:putative nucleotidyltransferase with HDIG domain
MNLARFQYRVGQFWKAMFARPGAKDLALVQAVLGSEPMKLFLKMQPGEQLHSVQVYRQVAAILQAEPVEASEHLLVAALLHDVGKSCSPLSLWERAVIVLGKSISPAWVQAWGDFEGPPTSQIPIWRRAFVVATQHARWGAEMAASAGVSSQAVRLISKHQDPLPKESATLEDRLLRVLQKVDDQW